MIFKALMPVFLSLILFAPIKVSAHANGQPYLSLNGEYVVTNPFGGVSGVEDMASSVFVAGQPIQFSVNTSVLSTPGQVYGWRWSQTDKDLQAGTTVTHAYSKPGSYVVSLESKVQADSQYREVNKIAVTIVPKTGYTLPAVQINATQMSGGTMRYEALATHHEDVGIKHVEWIFGDGARAEGEIVTHHYKDRRDFHLYPSVVVTDNNNIQTYALFQLEQRDGKITASDAPGLPRTVAKSVILSSRSTPYWQLALVPIVAIVVVLAARRIVHRRRSK